MLLQPLRRQRNYNRVSRLVSNRLYIPLKSTLEAMITRQIWLSVLEIYSQHSKQQLARIVNLAVLGILHSLVLFQMQTVNKCFHGIVMSGIQEKQLRIKCVWLIHLRWLNIVVTPWISWQLIIPTDFLLLLVVCLA